MMDEKKELRDRLPIFVVDKQHNCLPDISVFYLRQVFIFPPKKIEKRESNKKTTTLLDRNKNVENP